MSSGDNSTEPWRTAPIYGQTINALVMIPKWIFKEIDSLTGEKWEDYMKRIQAALT